MHQSDKTGPDDDHVIYDTGVRNRTLSRDTFYLNRS